MLFRSGVKLEFKEGEGPVLEPVRTGKELLRLQGAADRFLSNVAPVFETVRRVSKDLPLEYIARACRVFRIFEGPSEVHRWFIARDLLRNGMPSE